MPDTIRLVDYFYIEAPDKPGEGARALGYLKEAGVNLLAVHAFPKGRRSQLDFVPSDPAAFKAAAKAAKWKVVGPKRAFFLQGDDRVGALVEYGAKLAEAKINVTAVDALAVGAGGFAAIVWVKARDVKRAAKVLGAWLVNALPLPS
jgi:predicted amino acid-binding ACT domain protein